MNSPDPGPATAAPATANKPAAWWMIALAGVATQFLIMVNGVIAARMLGVEGRGQVVMVAILAGAASQLTLGGSLPNAITHKLAATGRNTRDGLRGFVGRWLLWGSLAGAVAALYLVFLERADLDSDVALLAVAVVLMALQAMASRILVAAMLGEETPPLTVALTSLLPQLVLVVVVGTALALGVRWNAVELLGVTILCTGLVLLARIRALAPGRGDQPLDRVELNAVARRTHIGSVGPIDGLGLDRILVGSTLGSAALGLYSAAFALGGLTNILAICLAMIALPQITKLQTAPDQERAFVRGWLVMSALLMGVVALGLVLLTEPVIRLTFGREFLDAVPVARWLVVGCGLLGFRRVLTAVLQGRSRGGVPSWSSSLSPPSWLSESCGVLSSTRWWAWEW
ncbi:lipopolysaccharide biosynthesis protein [Nocardioides alcanivorans]|uniref:lipopolysaccharide biosynthesis protein n=1 Tax=Nocardioides alcanivorans TaxID=2897352 RepID=UPI001F34C7B8|nr:oligosaccharide flippase family protein [Nocardioides alcanivorans]